MSHIIKELVLDLQNLLIFAKSELLQDHYYKALSFAILCNYI